MVLEYVSDGMEKGDDSNVSVNKLFEEYIYAAIKYAFLNNRLTLWYGQACTKDKSLYYVTQR